MKARARTNGRRLAAAAGLLFFAGSVAAAAATFAGAGATEVVRAEGPSPGVLSGTVHVSAPVAAVTFMVDGRPYASDTTAPYSVPILPHSLSAGPHRLRIVAATRDGRRLASPPTRFTLYRPVRVLTATPTRGLARALAALARGHVTVQLARGLYPNAAFRLGSGSTLLGRPGVVLRAPPSYDAVVTVAGAGVTLSGVTIDGGGPGGGDGHAVLVNPSSDVLVRRVTVVRARQDAVYMWGVLEDVSVQDSRFDGGGVAAAGVVAGIGEANDVSVIRTRISRFREFGVNFAQVRFDLTGSGLRSVALDNVITDIRSPVDTQGRSQGGIWTGGAAASIIGNRIARTGWDGIETVGTSDGVAIARNVVTSTRTGIYLEHATTRSQIAGNTISDVVTGINVEYRYQGVGSGSNTFAGNRVARAAQHGIFIDTGSDKNVVEGNRILMSTGGGIVLQGSSWNAVRSNVLCGPAPLGVVQQTGLAEDGSPVAAANNTLDGNVTKRRCTG